MAPTHTMSLIPSASTTYISPLCLKIHSQEVDPPRTWKRKLSAAVSSVNAGNNFPFIVSFTPNRSIDGVFLGTLTFDPDEIPETVSPHDLSIYLCDALFDKDGAASLTIFAAGLKVYFEPSPSVPQNEQDTEFLRSFCTYMARTNHLQRLANANLSGPREWLLGPMWAIVQVASVVSAFSDIVTMTPEQEWALLATTAVSDRVGLVLTVICRLQDAADAVLGNVRDPFQGFDEAAFKMNLRTKNERLEVKINEATNAVARLNSDLKAHPENNGVDQGLAEEARRKLNQAIANGVGVRTDALTMAKVAKAKATGAAVVGASMTAALATLATKLPDVVVVHFGGVPITARQICAGAAAVSGLVTAIISGSNIATRWKAKKVAKNATAAIGHCHDTIRFLAFFSLISDGIIQIESDAFQKFWTKMAEEFNVNVENWHQKEWLIGMLDNQNKVTNMAAMRIITEYSL